MKIIFFLLTICVFHGRIYSQWYSKEYKNGKQIERQPDVDFIRFPLVEYHIIDTGIVGIKLGDPIPGYLWELPLWTVNHPDGKDTIRLKDYKTQKLLVLDFWARWCKPCVASMDKWEKMVDSLTDQFSLIGVHMDYDYKAEPFIAKRDWKSATIIGGGVWVLQRHFFTDRRIVGRSVWIRDGKLIAITNTKDYHSGLVRQVMEGKDVGIPINSFGTYFEN